MAGMSTRVAVEVANPHLSEALRTHLRRAGVALAGTPASAGAVIATTRDASLEACLRWTRAGKRVIVLAALPSQPQRAAFERSGAVYLPLITGDGASLPDIEALLDESPETRPPDSPSTTEA
jgi:hypothetical protein